MSAGSLRMRLAARPLPPAPLPASQGAGGLRAIRRWKVLHAGEGGDPAAALLEAQALLGMRPSFAALAGAESKRGLLGAWNEVKRWRAGLASSGAALADVVHAHEFAAGMAAWRSGYAVAYDFRAPVEERRAANGFQAGAWLRRSMRAAEQFLLARAGAVVVHSNAAWDCAVQRGVTPEDLFLIPDPLECREEVPDREWLQALIPARNPIIVYAPGVKWEETGASHTRALLKAFEFVREELEGARLLVEADSSPQISGTLPEAVIAIGAEDRERALAAADLMISFAGGDGPDPVALAAMSRGRALLAADCAPVREISPDGRGCLWFRPGDPQDLAHRMAFLARNGDFRRSLGAAAQAHLRETRAPAVVAAAYDGVYRHASGRRRSPDLPLPGPLGIPALSS